jgi:hypothetical protein
MLLPFRRRNKKPTIDEQFIEVIKKLYVNVPLLEAMQVLTYAKYLKDILNNKRPMPTIEVVKLTEECSTAILNTLSKKKKEPRCPTISCSIETQYFDHALCDLGAGISVMPKVVFDKLNHTLLSPTSMCLQVADQSVHYLEGIVEDILVRIRNFLVPVDFVVLDMEVNTTTPLILGSPFLSTTNANIEVRAEETNLSIMERRRNLPSSPG